MTNSILVTGSSRGIGKAIALRLAADGFTVVVHCRERRTDADSVASQIKDSGGDARVLQFDIGDTEAVNAVIEQDIESHGAYYGIVCNAGMTADAAFPALTSDDWHGVINTNLNSFYNVVKPAIMPMIRRRKAGRIVAVTSVSGIMGNRGQVNYSAAKSGLHGAVRALAMELAGRRITVNAVAPGLIETDLLDPDIIERAMPMIPMKRIGTADEVAGSVSFLCSSDAAYITRQILSVNGGMC
ncbi:3-oxoacyl-ACP reductase FabG [Granulosicoccus antarcticus]|uniref:3-oxoacyl-[acyl-carrier-protein] reductase FabG n=1 Tax=Granulosicoccus antarcticus IMCC3135 TaxID=1192854 RepID=A0A2Z2P2K8_9GAMM|nr:3-oxoacyl-ACP reductase FabG [Granulosicoccus antarcticus]ASJ76861.1 3-oxoacyl-[acyl-carrier-protein] reductase FabG [Granulosicoccus antarcticus IMCC3135]